MAKSKYTPSFSQRVQQGKAAKASLLARLGRSAEKKQQKRPSSHAMTAAIQQLRTSASWLTKQQAGGMNRRVKDLEALARAARRGPLDQRIAAAQQFEAKLGSARDRLGVYELGRRNAAWVTSWSASVRGLRGEMERIEAGIFRRAKNEAWLTSEARLKRGATYMQYLSELYGESSYEKLYELVMEEQQGAVRQAEEWLADPEAIPAESEEERYRMVMAGIGLAMA